MQTVKVNEIIHGDSGEILKQYPDNSFDCIVTDPPYGLKFMGKKWDQALPPVKVFREACRVLKPGALAFVMSSPRQDLVARMIMLLEDAGFMTDRSYIDYIYKSGFPKAYDIASNIKKKFGKDADEWEGWKAHSGLKPAHEPVLMVYKPYSEATIVGNVLRWGVGGINVDATRIPFQNNDDLENANTFSGAGGQHGSYSPINPKPSPANDKGRFPANLLVSDRALDTGEITKARNGFRKSTNRNTHTISYSHPVDEVRQDYGDSGDQSRYFDLDAWAIGKGICDTPKPSTKERDMGLKGKKGIPKSKFNLNNGTKDMRFDGVVPKPRRNTHPTVKPMKLMAYLIELGCPSDGVVLDPFVGSGTTCMAAKRLGRKYIGIDLNEEYVEMAKARVAAIVSPLTSF